MTRGRPSRRPARATGTTKPPLTINDRQLQALAAAASAPIRAGKKADTGSTVYRCRDRKLNAWAVDELISCDYLERGQVDDDPHAYTLTPSGRDRLDTERARRNQW